MRAASEIFIGWHICSFIRPAVAAGPLGGGILNLTSLVDRLDLLLHIVLFCCLRRMWLVITLMHTEGYQSRLL